MSRKLEDDGIPKGKIKRSASPPITGLALLRSHVLCIGRYPFGDYMTNPRLQAVVQLLDRLRVEVCRAWYLLLLPNPDGSLHFWQLANATLQRDEGLAADLRRQIQKATAGLKKIQVRADPERPSLKLCSIAHPTAFSHATSLSISFSYPPLRRIPAPSPIGTPCCIPSSRE